MTPNPGPRSLLSQCMLDLQAAAIPAVAAERIMLGQVELLAGGNFWQEVADHGYHLVVGMPSGSASLYDWNGDATLTMELFYPVPADRSYDWTGPNDVVSRLVSAWASYAPWVKGRNRMPVSIRWDKPHIRTHEKPASRLFEGREAFIVSTKFVATIPFVSDQLMFPFENPAVTP